MPTDFELMSTAGKDVYRGCEAKTWRPYDLPQAMLVYWAVEQADGKICNGGLQYFFEADWPEKPDYAIFITAFRRIGATEVADCLEDAVAQFPFVNPHLHCDARNCHLDSSRSKPDEYDSIIDHLGDRIMELSDDTCTKLAAFIRANIDVFPSVKKLLQEN